MIGPTTFLKIGSFLPSAVLVSVAMIFTGLYEWVNAAWILDEAHTEPTKEELDATNGIDKPKWIRRRRPVLQALGVLIATHILGLLLFLVITTPFFAEYWTVRSQMSNLYSIGISHTTRYFPRCCFLSSLLSH
jgi:glycosylphosphatidylinositol transamidase